MGVCEIGFYSRGFRVLVLSGCLGLRGLPVLGFWVLRFWGIVGFSVSVY